MKTSTMPTINIEKSLLVVGFLLLPFLASAQLDLYTFKDSTTTYQAITPDTILGSGDDGPSSVFLYNDSDGDGNPDNSADGINATGPGYDIGFIFKFNGVDYDRFGVNTNGFITLGKSAQTPSVMFNESDLEGTPYIINPISDSSSFYDDVAMAPIDTAARNRISAFGVEIVGDAIQGDSKLGFSVLGVSPDRELVVQWESFQTFGSTSSDISFQIRLHETSNIIDFIYDIPTGVDPGQGNVYYPAVGLGGFNIRDTNDYINVSVSGSTPDWSMPTLGDSLDATCKFDETTVIPSGTWYRFTPPLLSVGLTDPNASQYNINIYPNPASDLVDIVLKDLNPSENIVLSITDIQGREVYSETINNAGISFTKKLDVSSFSEGMYLVNIVSGNKLSVKKLIIQ